MPRDLAAELRGHEVGTIEQVGWKGLKNGELLARATERFDALLSMDKNLPLQNEISRYRIGLILVRARSNRIEDLMPLAGQILEALAAITPGSIVRVG